MLIGQQTLERIYRLDWLIGEPDDHVTLDQPRALRGAPRFDRDDQHAALGGQIVKARDAAQDRRILPAHADITALDAPVFQQTGSWRWHSVRSRQTMSAQEQGPAESRPENCDAVAM